MTFKTPGPVTVRPRGCDLGPGNPHRWQRIAGVWKGVARTRMGVPRPGGPERTKVFNPGPEYDFEETAAGLAADDDPQYPMHHPQPGDFDGPPAD